MMAGKMFKYKFDFFVIEILFIILVLFLIITDAKNSSKNKCIDHDHRCSVWSGDGKCTNKDVLTSCPKSCETCSTINKDRLLQSVLYSNDQSFRLLLVIAGFVILGVIILLFRMHNCGNYCQSKGTLKGKVFIITGATSGIGLETAFHLAARGATLILGCRNLKRGFRVAKDIRNQTKQEFIDVKKLNLESLDSVRDFAQDAIEEYDNIHGLINNAAVITSNTRSTTIDGFETTFQVNYLAHYLLTKLLVVKLKASAPSRVVNLVSVDSVKNATIDFTNLQQGTTNYSNIKAYNNSKLALMLFTQEASNVLKGLGVTVNAADPGRCGTNLWRNCFPYNFLLTWLVIKPYTYLFWKMSNMGAETTYYCALDADLEKVSGKCFKECSEYQMKRFDDEIARKLWEISERLILPKRLSSISSSSAVENHSTMNSDENKTDKEENGTKTKKKKELHDD